MSTSGFGFVSAETTINLLDNDLINFCSATPPTHPLTRSDQVQSSSSVQQAILMNASCSQNASHLRNPLSSQINDLHRQDSLYVIDSPVQNGHPGLRLRSISESDTRVHDLNRQGSLHASPGPVQNGHPGVGLYSISENDSRINDHGSLHSIENSIQIGQPGVRLHSISESDIRMNDLNRQVSLPSIENPIQIGQPSVRLHSISESDNRMNDLNRQGSLNVSQSPVQNGHPCCRLHSTSESEASSIHPLELNRTFSSSITSFSTAALGNQRLSFGDRLKQMNSIVEKEIRSLDNPDHSNNTDLVNYDVRMKFEQLLLDKKREVKGNKEITDMLKFCLRIPLGERTELTPKQNSQLRHLSSAIFKECGFTICVSMIPLLCIHHKTSWLNLPRSSSRKCVDLIVLLELKNKKGRQILVDSDGRVYKDFGDWEKNNTLPPATLYGVKPPSPNSSQSSNSPKPMTVRMFKTPSCHTRKIAIHAVDIVVGIGAVSAGVACIVVTGGFVLPALIAGEIAASIYMGYRGSMSLRDKRRHQAKKR